MIKKCKKYTTLLPFIISVIGTIVSICGEPWFIISSESSFHFSLITVNAMFGGFLYTNYSILIGLLDNKIINKVRNTNIIQKRNEHILRGVIYAITSAIAGLYIVLFELQESMISNILYVLALNIEIVCMAFLIIYFLLSLREMNILIKNISIPIQKMTDLEVKDIKQKIENNTKEG